MNNLSRLVSFFIVFFLFFNFLQAQHKFQRFYNWNFFDEGRAIEQTSDSGYIFTGQVRTDLDDFLLAKIDSKGNYLWSKSYGTESGEDSYDLLVEEDGEVLIAGNAFTDIGLIKTGPKGDTIWTKFYGNDNESRVRDMVQTTDGGYVFTGYTQVPCCPFQNQILLFKVDSSGTLLWDKVYQYTTAGGNEGFAVKQTADGGYIIAGQKGDPASSSSHKMAVIKTNSKGDTLWTRTFDKGNQYPSAVGNDIVQTNDNDFMLLGQIKDFFTSNDQQMVLIKLDQSGNLLWNKVYGDSSEFITPVTMEKYPGGDIVVGGKSTFGSGGSFFTSRLTSEGKILWNNVYNINSWSPSLSPKINNDLEITHDGGIVNLGYLDDFNDFDFYVVKTDSMGNGGCEGSQVSFSMQTDAASLSKGKGFTVSSAIQQYDSSFTVNEFQLSDDVVCADTCSLKASFNASDTITCVDDTIQLTNNSTNANSYMWLKDGMEYSTGKDTALVVDTGGQYNMELAAVNNSCSDTAKVTISAGPSLSLKGVDSLYCQSQSPVKLEALPSGGTFSGEGIAGNELDPSSVDTGEYVMNYTYTDTNNCTGSIKKNYEIIEGLDAKIITESFTTCRQDNFDIGAKKPETGDGLWNVIAGDASFNNDTVASSSARLNGDSALITWNVSVNECSGSDTLLIRYKSNGSKQEKKYTIPEGTEKIKRPLLLGDTLTGDELGFTIINTPAKGEFSILNNNYMFEYAPSSSFKLGRDTVVYQSCLNNIYNCNSVCDTARTILHIPNYNPEIIDTSDVEAGQEVYIDSIVTDLNDNLVYSSFKITDPDSAKVNLDLDTVTGIFTVTLKDNFEQSAVDSLQYQICDVKDSCAQGAFKIAFDSAAVGGPKEYNPPELEVYNVLTPNNDGIHDYLKIKNIEDYKQSTVIIYNRWGTKVFEKSPYRNNTRDGFTGKSNTGEGVLPDGNYYYYIKVDTRDEPLKGSLYLKSGN